MGMSEIDLFSNDLKKKACKKPKQKLKFIWCSNESRPDKISVLYFHAYSFL